MCHHTNPRILHSHAPRHVGSFHIRVVGWYVGSQMADKCFSTPGYEKKKTASLEVECHFVEEEAQAVVKHGEKQPHTAYLRRNTRCIMDKVWDLVFAWAVWATASRSLVPVMAGAQEDSTSGWL